MSWQPREYFDYFQDGTPDDKGKQTVQEKSDSAALYSGADNDPARKTSRDFARSDDSARNERSGADRPEIFGSGNAGAADFNYAERRGGNGNFVDDGYSGSNFSADTQESSPEGGSNARANLTSRRNTAAARVKRRRRETFKTFTQIWSLIYLIFFAILILQIIKADFLPGGYLVLIIAVTALVSVLVFASLFLRQVKISRKKGILALSVILMVVYGSLIYFVGGTVGFLKNITTKKEQTTSFFVLAKKDSPLEKPEDLAAGGGRDDSPDGSKELTVGTVREGEAYSEARNRVRETAEVEFETQKSVDDAAEALLSGKYPAILLSEGHYDAVSEGNKKFKNGTKVIAEIEVTIRNEDLSKNVDVTEEPFNIYLSGLDTSGAIDVVSRSDVNMIITVNPKTHKVLLTSIPRDMRIRLMDKGGATDKLTHTGMYGIQETIRSAEDLTGLEMNYYLKVNYSTVKRFINAVGGVDVDNDTEFSTHGQKAKYTFPKGRIHLDGPMALAFARERKSFSDGDRKRNVNQEKIIEALIKKVTSSRTILSRYTSILKSCSDMIDLNMSRDEISSLIRMQLADGASWTVGRQSLSGTDASEPCYSMGSLYVYVMVPDPELLQKDVDKIISVMDEE